MKKAFSNDFSFKQNLQEKAKHQSKKQETTITNNGDFKAIKKQRTIENVFKNSEATSSKNTADKMKI